MLFQRRVFTKAFAAGRSAARCASGSARTSRWAAGTRSARGAVVVDRIHETRLDDITPALARRCGFTSLVDLLKTAKHGAGERVFVIDFHYDGKASARPKPGDRL